MSDRGVRVVIVDDRTAFRRAAAGVVTAVPGFKVVGEAETEQASVDLVESLHASLVLMDIELAEGDGLTATRRIAQRCPDAVVILMSTQRAADLPSDARTCGAAAYLAKDQLTPERLERLWQNRGDAGWPAS